MIYSQQKHFELICTHCHNTIALINNHCRNLLSLLMLKCLSIVKYLLLLITFFRVYSTASVQILFCSLWNNYRYPRKMIVNIVYKLTKPREQHLNKMEVEISAYEVPCLDNMIVWIYWHFWIQGNFLMFVM